MNHLSTSPRALFAAVLLALPLSSCAEEQNTAPSASLLRSRFPEHAGRVLTGEGSFVPSAHGFAAARTDDLAGWLGLAADLPDDGAGPVRLRLTNGDELRVREIGAEGRAEKIEGAVAYRRAGGTSFWTVVPGGVEEWLTLAAGSIPPSGLAAAWEIEGASLRQAGDAVEIADASGIVRVRVTAPAAFAASGRSLGVHLRAGGSSLELYVDPVDEDVLVDPVWISAAPMGTGRSSHASTKLADGRVLVAGGLNGTSGYLTSAEIYDPATNAWSATGSLSTARGRHTATLLPSGQVLIMGGYAGTSAPTTAELYDPSTGTFSGAGTISARLDHTATLLGNGLVLIAGGNSNPGVLSDALLYDPSAGTFTATPSMSHPHQTHTATLLADGRVLVAGSYSGLNVFTEMTVADLYDPTTNTWAAAPSMVRARSWHRAGLLADGRVVAAGGNGTSGSVNATAEIFDPSASTWTSIPSMSSGRAQASGSILPDGTFLMAGGYSGAASLATSERYDPSTNTWSSAGSMLNAHYGAITEPLSPGYVLVAGGNGNAGASYITAADIYTPLTANGGACSVDADCGSGFCVDGVCCSTACSGGTSDCRACSVAAGGAQNGVCGWVTTNVNSCAPGCTTIQRGTSGVVGDTFINAGAPTTPNGSSTSLSVGLSGAQRQGIVRFDLSAFGSTTVVTSSTLTVRMAAGGGPLLRVHQITSLWAEASVTWNSFAGGYSSTVAATTAYSNGNYTADITALLQSWLSGSASNYGVLLERDLTGVTTLYSSEYSVVASRPKLQLCTVAHP